MGLGSGSGAAPERVYFTRPRRVSSIATTVGFLEEVGSAGRAPPCNCRARFAETMMKRYVLCSGSSGIVQCALLRGGFSDMALPGEVNSILSYPGAPCRVGTTATAGRG